MDRSSPFRSATKSQTLLLNEQSRNLESQGKKVYKFGFGQSPFLPPAPVIEALQGAAHRKEYTPVQGLPELRESVSSFHNAVDGLKILPERVYIAPGSKSLLYTVMLAFRELDVLVPAPAWVSYSPQAELCGHRALKVPTEFDERWRVTPDALERVLRDGRPGTPSLLILNYPGNPEGLSYTHSELEAIASVLRKHGTWVIADEIYGLLHHQGQHVSLARHYPERSIITTGLSKWCGAGGWRLGVAMFPEESPPAMLEAVAGIASETYSCAPAPVQVAACTAYKQSPALDDYLFHQRRILSSLGDACHHLLIEGNLKVHKPEGGFYVLVDGSNQVKGLTARGISTDIEMCAALLSSTGVALLPGSAFGMEPAAMTARLAYVEFDGPQALAASMLVGRDRPLDEKFLISNAARTLEGLRELARWSADLCD